MSGLTFSRSVLRGRRRFPTSLRRLTLEHLERRIVLSGTPAAIEVDSPTESEQPAVPETGDGPIALVAGPAEHGGADGVLPSEPILSEADGPVQRCVDLQLLASSAEQLSEIPGGASTSNQLAEPDVVDAVIATEGIDSWVTEPIEDPAELIDPPSEPDPECSAPGGEEEHLSSPVISDFDCYEFDGHWIFTGEVTDDESVAGLEVEFGGLLAGCTATVQLDGTFEFMTTFPPGVQGTVTAITTDYEGLESEMVYCGVNV